MSKEVEMKKAALVAAIGEEVDQELMREVVFDTSGPTLSATIGFLITAQFPQEEKLLNQISLDSLKNLELWYRGWKKLIRKVDGNSNQ